VCGGIHFSGNILFSLHASIARNHIVFVSSQLKLAVNH
jgi:hypothetical protein